MMFVSVPGYHGNSEFRPIYELAKSRQTSPRDYVDPTSHSQSQPSRVEGSKPPPVRAATAPPKREPS